MCGYLWLCACVVANNNASSHVPRARRDTDTATAHCTHTQEEMIILYENLKSHTGYAYAIRRFIRLITVEILTYYQSLVDIARRSWRWPMAMPMSHVVVEPRFTFRLMRSRRGGGDDCKYCKLHGASLL